MGIEFFETRDLEGVAAEHKEVIKSDPQNSLSELNALIQQKNTALEKLKAMGVEPGPISKKYMLEYDTFLKDCSTVKGVANYYKSFPKRKEFAEIEYLKDIVRLLESQIKRIFKG